MDYNLSVDGRHFSVIWAALSELPAKHSFATMELLKAQVSAQEQAASQSQPASVPPPLPEAPAT